MSIEQQLKEKREKLGRAHEEYKSFRDGLDSDPEKWTSEQNSKFDDFDTEIDKLDGAVERLLKQEKIEARQKADGNGGGDGGGVTPPGGENRAGDKDPDAEKRSEAFDAFLTDGTRGMSAEQRGLMAGSDVGGGYTITPEKMMAGMLKEVDDMVKIRGLSTIHQLKKAASLGIITFDSDVDDWEWTEELATGSLDDGPTFGKRVLAAYPMAKRIKISKTLIRLSSMGVQALVKSRMAYKLATTMEYNYMLGDGQKKPLGLFVASDDGIPTSRDVSTDNTATVLKPDNLIEVQGTLKEAYQGAARWLFNRDAITKLRKLKTGDGQYLWEPGLKAGTSNTILAKGYVLSEWCPKTFTTGKYVGMYGDFKYYWIVDCLNMAIQVLNELYAEKNQIGYIGRYEGDGQPVMPEAFVRIQMG